MVLINQKVFGADKDKLKNMLDKHVQNKTDKTINAKKGQLLRCHIIKADTAWAFLPFILGEVLVCLDASTHILVAAWTRQGVTVNNLIQSYH